MNLLWIVYFVCFRCVCLSYSLFQLMLASRFLTKNRTTVTVPETYRWEFADLPVILEKHGWSSGMFVAYSSEVVLLMLVSSIRRPSDIV